jgi:membrane fusion protein (multidrug efflux system)
MADPTELEIQKLREEIRQLREQNGRAERAGNGAAPASPEVAGERPQPEDAGGPSRRGGIAGLARRHPARLIIGAILVIVLAAGGYFLWQYLRSYEDTDDARVDGHVNAITPRVAGVVIAVHVVENQAVKRGDLLVELDPRDYRVALERAQADLQQAASGVQARRTAVPITSISTQTGIETARSEVQNAQAALEAAEQNRQAQAARLAEAEANNVKAQADLARYRTLVAKDEVSREEYDRRVAEAAAAAAVVRAQSAAVDAARKSIDQRRAALQQAQARLQQAVDNAPEEVRAQRANVDVQQAAVQAARAAADQARLNLEYTKIYAPVDGIVGRRAVEVGQRVQSGQDLLAIVQVGDLWVTADFKETQLAHMHPGQHATIHVDTFNQNLDGYVESMPAASAGTFSLLPSENASGNYVKVVQRLPVRLRFHPGQTLIGRLRPGMSVEPKVWIR